MHIPVLLPETLEYLDARHGYKFIDCTVGQGGHTKAILEKNPKARVLGIDWDQTSLEKLKNEFVQAGLGPKVILVAGNYQDIDQIDATNQFGPVDGILLDLGFSSEQIDDPDRGLSFQTDGPLDMRYSKAKTLTAAEVVNNYTPTELNRVFQDFGEEKQSRRIVQAIARSRSVQPINSTVELSKIIESALPKPIRYKAADHQRRVFQALRIEVNHELDNLVAVLPKALKLLKPDGRLVIISFHSLEDRIVKKFFLDQAQDCVCPPEFPTCICEKTSNVRILTRKPIKASEAEIIHNPRSKAAKLRAIVKV